MISSNKPKGRSGDRRDSRQLSSEFDQAIIEIARVTRVMAGGKRMRFRACVIVGNKKGRIGMAIAKGADVTLAVNKAVTKAQKSVVNIPIYHETIPHRVDYKYGAARLMIKPAPKGTGIIAGGAVRAVLELAGVSNVVAKILGSGNKINNVKATIEALKKLKWIEPKKSEAKEQNNKVESQKGNTN